MGTTFWIRRYLLVFAAAFVVIALAEVLRGRTLEASIIHGLIWSAISAGIFVGARVYQSRKGRYCAICNDIPVDPESKRERAA